MSNTPPPKLVSAHQLPLRPFILIGFVSLLLPNILLLWGWFTPIVSIPLTILLIASFILIDRSIQKQGGYGFCFPLSRFNIVKLIIALVIIAIYTSTRGLLGGFACHADFWVFRHALYLNLTDAPWPVILPNGKEFTS